MDFLISGAKRYNQLKEFSTVIRGKTYFIELKFIIVDYVQKNWVS